MKNWLITVSCTKHRKATQEIKFIKVFKFGNTIKFKHFQFSLKTTD